MKNKRLIIILSVFSFLVLIAVLCSTVFTVKSVSLRWLTTTNLLNQKDSEIIEDVQLGESVFLVDKEAIITKLENKYPYLKVVSVEVQFPNKLVVHTAERQSLYSLKIKDNKHVIMDAECKVLAFATDSKLDSMSQKPIPLTLDGYVYNEINFEESKVAELGWIKNIINNFSIALYQCGYEEVDSKNIISSIEIDVSGHNEEIQIGMAYKDIYGKGGVNIEIQEISQNLSAKFIYAMEAYAELSAEEKSEGLIRVYSNSLGKVVVEYSPEE